MSEGLVQAYVLPYLRIILGFTNVEKIVLVTREKPELKPAKQHIDQLQQEFDHEGIEWVVSDYRPFGLTAMLGEALLAFRLYLSIRKKGITHLHVWCTPAGVLGYLLSKLTRVPLIIDSFEPHAEAQVENGTWSRNSLGFRLLWYFENQIARHAKHLIYTSANTITYAQEKYGAYDPSEFVKPACVDPELFAVEPPVKLQRELNLEGCVVGVYSGKLGGIYHDRELFQLAAVADQFWQGKFRLLMLTNEPDHLVHQWAKEAGFRTDHLIKRFVRHAEVPRYLSLAHFGITLVKSVPTKRCCTPIKNGEYWASGLPVIITAGIGDDSDLIQTHRAGYVLQSLDPGEMEAAIAEVDFLISEDEREQTSMRARQLALKQRSFKRAIDIYRTIYGTKS
ncbi:MAG: hypothetical protein Kow0075_09200 [Salibacteraceae bacterium]